MEKRKVKGNVAPFLKRYARVPESIILPPFTYDEDKDYNVLTTGNERNTALVMATKTATPTKTTQATYNSASKEKNLRDVDVNSDRD